MLRCARDFSRTPEILIFAQQCFSEGAYSWRLYKPWSLGPRPLPPAPLSRGQKTGAKLCTGGLVWGRSVACAAPVRDEGDVERTDLTSCGWMDGNGRKDGAMLASPEVASHRPPITPPHIQICTGTQYGVGSTIPISQMWKVRFREVISLAYEHVTDR